MDLILPHLVSVSFSGEEKVNSQQSREEITAEPSPGYKGWGPTFGNHCFTW